MDSLWWYHFYHAMDVYGYHHWEAELYADEKTGGGFSALSIPTQDFPSIAESCYIDINDVFPKQKKEQE